MSLSFVALHRVKPGRTIPAKVRPHAPVNRHTIGEPGHPARVLRRGLSRGLTGPAGVAA